MAATASSGARASLSVGGSRAPPPPDRRKLPGSSRRAAMRSGKRGRDQPAGVAGGRNRGGQVQPAAILAGGAADPGERAAIHLGVVRRTVGQRVQAQRDIGRRRRRRRGAATARPGRAQQVAFLQQRREGGGERGLRGRFGGQHHRRQPRMRPQRGHPPAGRGDRAGRIERAEVFQQGPGGGEGAGGRRIGERQVGRRGAQVIGPDGAGEAERGQFGLQDLRPVEGGQAAMQRLGPEADRHARPFPPGAPGALFGGRAGEAGGDEAGEAGAGVEPGGAAEAAVDDDAHAGDGQRGLGDRGRQHHPPRAARGQAERRVLRGRRQVAVQREDVGGQAGQRGFGATDLGHAGKEGEDVPRMGGQRGADGPGHRLGQVARGGEVAGGVAQGDGVGTAGAFDHGGIEQGGEAGGLGGGGHRDQAQVRAQAELQVAQQGQREVGLHAAFVDLVQDHRRGAVQQRVGEQAAEQQALGEDLDPRRRGDGGVEPCAVADQAAGGLAAQRGHAGGGGAGGEAAGFEDEDALVAAPGGGEQGRGDEGGLAGAGRGDKDDVASVPERGEEGGEDGGDGEGQGGGVGGVEGHAGSIARGCGRRCVPLGVSGRVGGTAGGRVSLTGGAGAASAGRGAWCAGRSGRPCPIVPGGRSPRGAGRTVGRRVRGALRNRRTSGRPDRSPESRPSRSSNPAYAPIPACRRASAADASPASCSPG